MARVTKIRDSSIHKSLIYNPKSTHLAVQSQVEDRVLVHNRHLHNDRNSVTRINLDINDIVTNISTYSDITETILYASTDFSFVGGNLTLVDKKIFSDDGLVLIYHKTKELTYDVNGNISSIIDTKVI